MEKRNVIIKIFMILAVSFGILYANELKDITSNDLAKKRNTLEGTLELITTLQAKLKAEPNSYDASWQYAAICYFYGDYYLKDNDKDKKKKYFTLCKDAAENAVKLNPKGVDGHYWLGIGLGMWSDANGILDSLFFADDVANEMTKVIEMNPAYFRGTPWMVRASVYAFAPGWPLSIGDTEKAYADVKMAFKYGGDYRVMYVLYCRILMHNSRWKDAMIVINKGLALPYDKNIPVEEDAAIAKLKDYKIQVQKELK
jgi:hypothetical protein